LLLFQTTFLPSKGLPCFRNKFEAVTTFAPSSLCDKMAGTFEKKLSLFDILIDGRVQRCCSGGL
jgi:hypothetical protein